jgi:hypothetical protein
VQIPKLGRAASALMLATVSIATMASPASAATPTTIGRWVNGVDMDVTIGATGHCTQTFPVAAVYVTGPGTTYSPHEQMMCSIPRTNDVIVVHFELESYVSSGLWANGYYHVWADRPGMGFCGEPFGGRSNLSGTVSDTFAWTDLSKWTRAGTLHECNARRVDDITIRATLYESWTATAA